MLKNKDLNLSDKQITEIAESIVDTWDMQTVIENCINTQVDYINSLTGVELKQYLADQNLEFLLDK
ncbi:MAG: hypothetical protein WC967_13445 [Balneolaceae bacterium]